MMYVKVSFKPSFVASDVVKIQNKTASLRTGPQSSSQQTNGAFFRLPCKVANKNMSNIFVTCLKCRFSLVPDIPDHFDWCLIWLAAV